MNLRRRLKSSGLSTIRQLFTFLGVATTESEKVAREEIKQKEKRERKLKTYAAVTRLVQRTSIGERGGSRLNATPNTITLASAIFVATRKMINLRIFWKIRRPSRTAATTVAKLSSANKTKEKEEGRERKLMFE